MFTLILLGLVAGLQTLHLRLLCQLAGPGRRRWLLAALALNPLRHLAGHTHGGQVNLIPGFDSARLIGQRYSRGLYDEGGHRLYVNRGLGVIIVPVRFGAPPEITVVALRRGS